MQPACVDGGGCAAPAAALLTARCAPAAGDEGETHAERLRRLDAEVAVLRSSAAQNEAGLAAKVRSPPRTWCLVAAHNLPPSAALLDLSRSAHTESLCGSSDSRCDKRDKQARSMRILSSPVRPALSA